MSRVALRWGSLYLLMLLLVSGLGLVVQKERQQIHAYQQRYTELEREKVDLLDRYEAQLSNRAVALWAESQGMVPMSEGRWVK